MSQVQLSVGLTWARRNLNLLPPRLASEPGARTWGTCTCVQRNPSDRRLDFDQTLLTRAPSKISVYVFDIRLLSGAPPHKVGQTTDK